jgi:hypothetical protein
VRQKLLVIAILVILTTIITPSVGYAHCSWNGYYNESVLSWFSADASWSYPIINTWSYQRWGAPYCWVKDGHKIYKWTSSGWQFIYYTYWYDYDSDYGFDHVWVPHEQNFWISSTGKYRAVMGGKRIANHLSILPHYMDVDVITEDHIF